AGPGSPQAALRSPPRGGHCSLACWFPLSLPGTEDRFSVRCACFPSADSSRIDGVTGRKWVWLPSHPPSAAAIADKFECYRSQILLSSNLLLDYSSTKYSSNCCDRCRRKPLQGEDAGERSGAGPDGESRERGGEVWGGG